MKKLILLLALTLTIFSCSDDDADAIIPVVESSIIRISQVDTQADLVVLSNLGTTAIDIADHFLCLGPGTYVRVSDTATGSTNLSPNQSITLSYDVNETSGGLSVFSTNTFGSTDPNILLDYIQWGAGNQARVGQAVTAGRWDSAANFLPLAASYSFTGEADDFGSAFYDTAGAVEVLPVVRILQVDASTDRVWLSNFGAESIDVADYFLCLGPGTYLRVADATTSSTVLAPGANVMLNYDVNEVADGLSIFSEGGNFGSTDPNILVDYLQWGAGNQARVGQAVTAGRWDNAENFVAVGTAYNFTGEADDFGSSFYETVGTAAPVVRILQLDSAGDRVWLGNSGSASIDVADYFLCLGPGTYVRVSDATTSSTVLAPGANVMLTYDVVEAQGGLSIFSEGGNFGSTDPNILVDYLQWGAGNQARVSQAVTAGRWDNANNFVADGSPYVFNGNADDFGSTFWTGTEVEESTVIRIAQVNASTDQVWLANLGNTSVDVADYFLCLGPGTYVRVSDATSSSTVLAPGENVMLSYNVTEAVDGLSVFSTNSFGSTDPNILIDYVQWGGANQARVSQAVTAGRWDNAANFITDGPAYMFNGGADDFGSTFW